MDHDPVWLPLGFLRLALFSLPSIVPWIKSERMKRSVVPLAFWYFSLAGGAALFVYSLHRNDPVFIFGQGPGIFIYLRSLWLIYCEPIALSEPPRAA